MELRDYVRVLRKQWRLILLCTVLAIGAAAAVTYRATPMYQTGAKFFVSTSDQGAAANSSSAYTGSLFSQQRVKSYATIAAGPAAADQVAAAAGLSPAQVRGRVTAAAVPDTVLLQLTVRDASPEAALQIARGFADFFPGIISELERPAGRAAVSPVKMSVVEQPALPAAPFSPRPVRNLALALVLGVLLVQDKPRAARAEAFRQLRTNLQFLEVDEPVRSFVITSSVPKEGKSTTACNLAITLAQAGVRTLLIEGDLRRPRIADYLGLEGAIGVTNVLIGQVPLQDALQPWGNGTLSVLASGPLPPNPSELLASRGMHELLAEVEKSFDMVIIDAPPLLPVTDAAILSTMTGGALLGVRCRSTKRDQLRRAADALEAVDARVLGAVLNMVPRRGPDAYYSYGYGYGGYSTYDRKHGKGSKPHLSDEEASGALVAAAAQPAGAAAIPVPEPQPQPQPQPQLEPQPQPEREPVPAAAPVAPYTPLSPNGLAGEEPMPEVRRWVDGAPDAAPSAPDRQQGF
ncbi:MAG: polysaccharide biosynthesis tyrosine autokinase [Actinobacteria bacterium]|nr:polysaccharide biosynthesis tyrosine autokinase [Actinomycetota bacterium]